MSFVEELEERVKWATCRLRAQLWTGPNVTGAGEFLQRHGPRILAAVRLAEVDAELQALDDEYPNLDYDRDYSAWRAKADKLLVVRKVAVAAYRAACAKEK